MNEDGSGIPVYKFALREDLKNNPEFLPTKAEPNAAGWDVRAALKGNKYLTIRPFDYFMIPLGFRGFCPEGWYYHLHPRSSSFVKKNMHNLIGIIDTNWEGETLFAGQYIPDGYGNTNDKYSSIEIKFGDKIAQILPIKIQNINIELISNEEYDRLCKGRNGIRKDGGFGSTG